MKKSFVKLVIGYWSLFGILGICFLEFSPPVFAFSWQDYFPPIKLEESKRQPPDTAIAPEVVGGLNAYSNLLGHQVKCIKKVKLVRFWEPKTANTDTTDSSGNPIKEFVAQDARDLEDQDELQNLSNNGLRNFQSLFAKGEVKSNIESTQDSFKDMNISGMGAFTRMNSINNLDVERSRYLMDVVESLNTTDPEDVVAQDVQIAWDCNGTVTELSQKPKKCRPITVSELLYGLRDLPLYFTDDYALPPTTFPQDTIDFISGYYPNGYQQRFNSTFTQLPLETYLSMYYQLNAPKGNVDNKIKITNFDCYVNGKPDCPVVTGVQRNLPAAVALAAPQSKTFNQVASINAPPLPNSSDEEYCTDFAENDIVGIDKPPVSTIMLWVHGLFKHLAPGESYRHEEGIELVVRNDVGLARGSRDVEKSLLQLIPAENITKNDYLNKTFTSATSSNAKYGIIDPCNRCDKIYNGSYINFLRPASWQKP